LKIVHKEDKKMSKLKTLIKTTLTPIALCLTLAIAAPAMAKKGQHQKHDGMRQILSELSLTATQKQDIRQVLKQSREDRELIKTDDSVRTDLRSLIQSTEWDQTAVESALIQNQAVMQDKALQRATNKNQIWNLLTETQQAEFVALLDTRKAEREEKKGKGKRKDKMLKRLDLTEEQLTAVEVIKTAAKASGEETKAKLKTFRQAEQALVQNNNFNAEAWLTLNNKYQADFLAMAVLKAQTKHDVWSLLTTEQQAKAVEKMQGKKNKHGKKGKKRQQQETV
jgi:Spy/CpxP family protein refolding chaperone